MKKAIKLYPIPSMDSTPPTEVMLETLKRCTEMERDFPGKPYGPVDIGRSFIGLFNRGLVETYPLKGHKDGYAWRITSQGFLYLLSKCKFQQEEIKENFLKQNSLVK
jgi:hypothetical protein